MGLNVGVQWMMSKFGSFHVSESAACSSCFFYANNEEQCPITETVKHIFCCSRVICRRSVFLLQSSQPLCPQPPYRPSRVWAASLGDGLNLTKLIFKKGRGTTTLLLLFLLSSWDAADIWWTSNCVTFDGEQRENSGTQESRLHSEWKAFCRDFAAVLQAGCFHWALHQQMAASQPLIIPHCATKTVRSRQQ